MRQRKALYVMVLFLLFLCGCRTTDLESTPTVIPTIDTGILDEIIVKYDNLFPEGIEYDREREHFLLSSATEGTVFQVLDDGTIEPLIIDPDLEMSLGIEIDYNNQRLLVTNNHSDDSAYLGAYDLETGQRIFMANLSDLFPESGHLANDVAVDVNGIAYVTDTVTPVIYSVDLDGTASIFLEDPVFDSLNGIVAHADGYLLLGSCCGKLLKIPTDDPTVIQVDIPGGYLGYEITDGMILHPDGSLIMLTFPDNKIGRLMSEDNWTSATHVSMSSGHSRGYGTTLALRGEDVYVIHSYLYRRGEDRVQRTFEITLVEFH